MIAECIQAGAIKPGEQLPTEHTLAAHFSVNRHTIRRALGHLETIGLLHVVRGRGTFVHENVIDYHLSRRTRFSENLKRQNKEASGTILDMGEKVAPRAAALALGLKDGEQVVWLRVLKYADERPISVTERFYPLRRFQGFQEVYAQRQSVAATFEYFGFFDYTRKSTRITARMPSVEEMDKLKLPRNRPVLVTESIDIDSEGEPIEYGCTAFHGEAVQLVVDADDLL